MKKPIFTILAIFTLLFSAYGQITKCSLEGQNIACKDERVTIQFDTDADYTEIKIDAFTVINGTQVIAIQENITDTSADIIFLAGGDAEIVVRFLDGNTLTSLCNLNVFVFDEEPIPAVGILSNFVEDQVSCEAIDLSFEMFIVCPKCPFYWTLNDEIIEIDQQVAVDSVLQLINARLIVEGVGSYTFCQRILKQDSTCFIEDCITIDIVELDVIPSFTLDDENSIFCQGATLNFINETILDENVTYIWEVVYDSLVWRYSGETLDFDFLFPGTYEVSLQYFVVNNEKCISDKTTMVVEISDAPIIPITCSSNSCQDSIFTYQVPITCEDYNWIIDESLGEIISNDENGITIKWNKVEKYTETKISLLLGDCAENACDETFRNIILFPENIIVEGPRGICDKGTEWYEADFIPDAEYIWEIEIIDSISGILPQITKIEDNRVRITFNSFVGNIAIRVNATLESRGCEASGEFIATSLLIITNDNLCPGDLFKASVLPAIDQDVVWTLSNDETGYFNQQTKSGQDQFFAFDLTMPGDYVLNVAIPELEFECGDEIPLTVLNLPEVTLSGPTFICPGDSISYTLEGLGGNDLVEWTIFQNNTSTDLVGNTIKVLWLEGGEPYSIKVTRSTEVMPGQFCESESSVFAVSDIKNQVYEIIGPEVVCYDGQGEYQVSNAIGTVDWEIDPPYMGTIIEGDSTASIVIQWHYAPDIPFATLSMSREICDSIYESEIDVYFEPFVPELIAPDTVCQRGLITLELLDLESYTTVDIYVNDVLERENVITHSFLAIDTGIYDIRIEIVNPNGCPGVTTITKQIYSLVAVQFGLLTSRAIKQCPKESFEDVIVTVDFQDSESYYIWRLGGEIVQEGFGEEALYTFVITKAMIEAGIMDLTVSIDPPDLCPNFAILPMEYVCYTDFCACLEPIDATVDYLTMIECNLATFGGSIDFSTVINPYWSIVLLDTVIIIPINGPEDLIQDSFYFDGIVPFAQVALRGSCNGVIARLTCENDTIYPEIIDTTICNVFIDENTEDMYYPDFVTEYICNEDLTYDIIFTERRLRNTNPPFSSTVTWVINGVVYEGISIVVEDVPGGIPLSIEMTQCSLDGTYCCTMQYETTARKEFSPNIILPNGSCENDLWLFTLDINQSGIESTLWDFGDGSGSTLFLTEKGFLDTLSHDISVVVTDELGCVATSEITVQTFINNIDGEIQFESDPCAPSIGLTYIENSESIINQYEWDVANPIDTSSIQVSISGNYSVTVTDVNGCTDVANIQDLEVNESFAGGIRFKPENCGVAAISVFANNEYQYNWYFNGDFITEGSNILLSTPGEHEIKVTSTSLITGEICDSIVENIVIYPLPIAPLIQEEKIFCDPFITELSLLNYPSALWNSNVDLQQEAASILVSQNGTYRAIIIDENGCSSSSIRTIDEGELPFDQLLDQCIQACREDLDSLQITIPGINESFSNWTWVTVDTFGIEYEVLTSSGIVTPLTITSDMYKYVQLQITRDDCLLRSEQIPLDIELCSQPEPPEEIICEPIDSDHANCGLTIYKCLLSEENGGPKLYYEGSLILPMDAILCSEDSLTVSLNNGQIVITDLVIEEADGKIMAFYSANIIISDLDDYKENGTVIKFDFCNEEGEFAFCYEYTLPYRTCNKDFSCLIDYNGISAGGDQMVDINYCMNLSEVVQDECTLTAYEIRAIISGDISIKTIYTEVLEGDFANLHCISVPISQEDFYSGEYQCIELMIEGNCPGIKCSQYRCGLFGSSNLMANEDVNLNSSESFELSNIEKNIEIEKEVTSQSMIIYPNPSTGIMTFEIGSIKENSEIDSKIIIRNTIGQIVQTIKLSGSKIQTEDLSDQMPGLYLASFVQDGMIVSVHKFLLVK